MKKFFLMLSAMVMALTTAVAQSGDVTFALNTGALFGCGNFDVVNIDGKTFTQDGISLTFNHGTNGIDAPTYDGANWGAVIFKQGHTMTVSADGGIITKMEFQFVNNFNCIKPETDEWTSGEYSVSNYNGTWTGAAATVTDTHTKSTPVRIEIIKVYYTSASSAPEAPVIAATGVDSTGVFKKQTQVTITGVGDIYYTLDGTEPDASATKYEAPFTLTSTTTVKAQSILNGKASEVASQTYTLSDIIDISAAIQMPGRTKVAVEGTVVAVSQEGLVLGDGTGYIYYGNTNGNVDADYAVGDQLVIRGGINIANGMHSLSASGLTPAVITKTGHGDYKQPKPQVLKASALDAWVGNNGHAIQYVRFSGTSSQVDGDYSLTVADAASGVTLLAPVAALQTKLNEAGVVTVTGYAVYSANGAMALMLTDVMDGDITKAKTFVLSYDSWVEKKDGKVATFVDANNETTFSISAKLASNGNTPESDKLSTAHQDENTFVVDDEPYKAVYFLNSFFSLSIFTVAPVTEGVTLLDATLCSDGSTTLRNPDSTSETILQTSYHTPDADGLLAEGNYDVLELGAYGFRFCPYTSLDGVVAITYLVREDPTGIDTLTTPAAPASATYSLQGQRLSRAARGLQVVNGELQFRM